MARLDAKRNDDDDDDDAKRTEDGPAPPQDEKAGLTKKRKAPASAGGRRFEEIPARRSRRRCAGGGGAERTPREMVDAATKEDVGMLVGPDQREFCVRRKGSDEDLRMTMRAEGPSSRRAAKDGPAVLRWAVDLAGRTLREMHEECWGWDEKAMLKELKVSTRKKTIPTLSGHLTLRSRRRRTLTRIIRPTLPVHVYRRARRGIACHARSHTHTQTHLSVPWRYVLRLQSSAALLLVVRHTAHDGAQLRVGEASTSNVGAGPGAPAAYCHFRFDIEFGEAVLYLYEMHVEPEWQGTGLGGRMMAALKSIARESGMGRILLTVRLPPFPAFPVWCVVRPPATGASLYREGCGEAFRFVPQLHDACRPPVSLP